MNMSSLSLSTATLSPDPITTLPLAKHVYNYSKSIRNLYPNYTEFGHSCDFRFSLGDLHDANIFIDPQSGAITGISIDWEAAAFRLLWAEFCGVGWFEEDNRRFIFSSNDRDPENFSEDTNPKDMELLRAFFRTELHKKNSYLFLCFLGGFELHAVLHAAVVQWMIRVL